MPRTSCLYGNSGDSKTTQLYFVAKWLWETLQLRSRLISFDGKFDQFTLGHPSLLEQGAVEVFNMMEPSHSHIALASVRKLSEGYWPRKKKGGGEHFRADEDCLTKDWDKIGAYLIDGISGWADIWLGHVADQAIGFKASWNYEEEGYEFHGSQDGHYLTVQKEMVKTIKQNFNQLPCKYVMYTALVEKGIENYRRKRVKRNDANAPAEPNVTTLYGPKGAGQAQTSFIPGWFSDCFHIARLHTKNGEDRVAWYDTHTDETTDVPYLARIDVLPNQMVNIKEKWKYGCVLLTLEEGIDKFYRFIEEVNG